MTNEALKAARISKGKTQLEIAQEAGVSRGSVALLEAGQRPSKRTADKVAAALGVDPVAVWPDYLTFWRG